MNLHHSATWLLPTSSLKLATVALWLFALLPCLSLADGNDKAQTPATLFDTYCLSKASDYAELGRRATDAHYDVFVDRSILMPNGQVMRQKNWLIPSQDGGAATMLTSFDVTNGSLHVFGCGIFVPALDGAGMESALSALPRLGPPVKHSQANGGTVTSWLARVGDNLASADSQVMLFRDMPSLHGIEVNLTLKTHLNH